MSAALFIHRFPGIRTDSLGHYLMGPGLLRAVSSRWPKARGFWHDGAFYLAGDFTIADVEQFLAADWKPTTYEKWWTTAQKADTKARASLSLPIERSQRPIHSVRLADATIVGVGKNQFNPLFGTGGNIGKRDLATAWSDAFALREDAQSRDWLRASLFADQTIEAPSFSNGGTWFVYNNKAFNSGLSWYRDGALSPWSFLLAMEGALLLAGGSGRRLGSKARPYAVFPFISQPLQPEAREEVGQMRGEFWAPLWAQPATLTEVSALLRRGLAKLGGKAASAPHEFAVAALAAGADAGVSGFVRFELRQTTSSQVYEAIPREHYPVARESHAQAEHASLLLREITGGSWLDRLPGEPFTKQSKTKFSGLRGPIERAILAAAAAPGDPERWQHILLKLALTQARVDRNGDLRKKCVAIPWLQTAWFTRAFGGAPPLEVRLAAAMASLGASGSPETKKNPTYAACANLFGVAIAPNRQGRGSATKPVFSTPGRPQRAVWHDGESLAALLDFVGRRLVDAHDSLVNFASPRPLSPSLIAAFLDPEIVNLALVQRWLPPLALIDWTLPIELPRADEAGATPELLVWAFFKPFFHPKKLPLRDRTFFLEKSPDRHAGPSPPVARQLFHHLRRGAAPEAIALASAGYQAQGWRVIEPPAATAFDAPRLAAALALPIASHALSALIERWLEPPKRKTET